MDKSLMIVDDSATMRKIIMRTVRMSGLNFKRTEEAGNGVEALEKLKQAAAGTDNLMPRILECSRTYCTLGEMIDVLKSVFGLYKEPIIY